MNRITLTTPLIPTRRRRWVYWSPIAELAVLVVLSAVVGAWIWVIA